MARQAIHFVGFKGEEVISAYRIWGRPDFWHRFNDDRVAGDVAPGDTVVHANRSEDTRPENTYNDSAHF